MATYQSMLSLRPALPPQEGWGPKLVALALGSHQLLIFKFLMGFDAHVHTYMQVCVCIYIYTQKTVYAYVHCTILHAYVYMYTLT